MIDTAESTRFPKDTPRTNTAIGNSSLDPLDDCVDASFARLLERELNDVHRLAVIPLISLNKLKQETIVRMLHECAGLTRDLQRQLSSGADRAHINDTLRLTLLQIQRVLARVSAP